MRTKMDDFVPDRDTPAVAVEFKLKHLRTVTRLRKLTEWAFATSFARWPPHLGLLLLQ